MAGLRQDGVADVQPDNAFMRVCLPDRHRYYARWGCALNESRLAICLIVLSGYSVSGDVLRFDRSSSPRVGARKKRHSQAERGRGLNT
jgi:hypothetical protein